MKKISLFLAIFSIALLPSLSSHAQQSSLRSSTRATTVSGDRLSTRYAPSRARVSTRSEFQPLSTEVAVAGADSLPITGHLEQTQSDGRGLHNIQVDPSNSQNVHAVIMELISADPKDTNLTSRRILYTFSSDGGKHWKTPDTLGNTRTGFACMILYKRGNNYVPIIAAHRYLSTSSNSLIESAIWIEKGNPGDGNFEETGCGTQAFSGTSDLLWPYIAISPKDDTIYILGCYSNPTSSTSFDYMEFGTFALDGTGHAKFNGWNQEIGASNTNDQFAGLVENGDYVMRVSPQGKVGILWRETDLNTPNASLYFIESTDDGNTWPQDFLPLELIADQNVSNGGLEVFSGPYTGLDFFYAGENAKIVWSQDDQTFSSKGGSYFPAEMALHFFDVARGSDYEFVSNRAGTDGAIQDDSSQHSLVGSLATYNNTIDKETDPYIFYPTIAQTSNPNVFAVFYQIFPVADTVTDDTGGVWSYGSIYYQSTSDGGTTWSAPAPFRTNTGDPGTYGKIDFRWPQVSDWNAPGTFTALYGADTAAGTNVANGTPPWDVVNFFHDQLAFSGVSNGQPVPSLSLQSYPNPITTSTTLDFSLPAGSNTVLSITDMLGRPIATLIDGFVGAGEHHAVFSAGNLANGVYRCTLESGGVSISKSLSIVR